jgi:hypothetical protein
MFNNFMPTPLVNAYQSPMQMYARGGHADYPYHQEAHMLQEMGTGRDRILAHLNPAEARYLMHTHGMSVNPHTGLPQFGLWDSIRSGLGKVGSAVAGAAPGIWEQFGRPIAQSALQGLDTGIRGALPNIGQAIGSRFGGERGAQLGQSFGQNLGNQFGNLGGISGQVLPRVDARAGMQGQAAPSINPLQMAANVGRGVWGDVGRNMAREGLVNLDVRAMNALPGLGQRAGMAVGNVFNRPELGSQLGGQLGSRLGEAYGESPGISGYAMPRMHAAVQGFGRAPMANPAVPQQAPEVPAFAQGGHMYNMGGYMSPYMY